MSGLWLNPTGGQIRVDADGDGHYGTRRLRKGVSVPGGHHGIDLLCGPGQEVRAPFDALVVRDGRVYADTPIYRLLVLRRLPFSLSSSFLEGEGRGEGALDRVELKLMYVQPRLELLGRNVKVGEMLGRAQNVRDRYRHAAAMQPHVHVELRKNGALVDPTPFFFA